MKSALVSGAPVQPPCKASERSERSMGLTRLPGAPLHSLRAAIPHPPLQVRPPPDSNERTSRSVLKPHSL
eukprot:2462949-Prymnesium_polylepis.1